MMLKRVLVVAALALLAGCGGGGGGGSVAPQVAATPTAAPPGAAPDDWVTFAHDQQRSGLERQPTGIDRTSAARLRARWTVSLHEPIRSSPIAVAGSVYVATDSGTVVALDAVTGAVRWRTQVGTSVRMTPALIDGTLFVAAYGVLGANGSAATGAAFVALDPASGALRWSVPPPNGGAGLLRAEPVVLNGVVYEGIAGGDGDTGCVPGGIMALDERTGASAHPFWLTSTTATGGGVWSPLSTDGTSIFAGTGNVCAPNESADAGDAVISYTTSLTPNWMAKAFDPSGADEDVGGGLNVANPLAYVAGKSGFLYALDRNTGLIAWSRDMHPWQRGGGSIGTATGDGTMILVSGGELGDPTANATPGCTIYAFDLSGNPLYTLHANYVVGGYAAFVAGVGFIGLDHTLVAFDARTGATLWSSGDLGDNMRASPVVVPSGVYTATLSGDVVAFGIPGVQPSSARKLSAATPAARSQVH